MDDEIRLKTDLTYGSLRYAFDQLNAKHFGNQLPLLHLYWNSRLRSSAGRFMPGHVRFFIKREPKIEIAEYLIEEVNGWEHVLDTMAHEMIHYWLWLKKKPYGHTAEFKKKMKEMGVSRYNPVPKRRGYKWVYACGHCKKEILRKRRFSKSVACRACCKIHSKGIYDHRFALELKGEFILNKFLEPPLKDL